MKFRDKQITRASAISGMAQAALHPATPEALVNAALDVLLAKGGGDRLGVWIEAQRSAYGMGELRGRVIERDGQPTPSEWARLSPEAQLPEEVVTRMQIFEQELEPHRNEPALGVLLDMRSALWAPVEHDGRLRGVLLGAGRRKDAGLQRSIFERVAGEMVLALELREQQRLARERQHDLAFIAKMLTASDGAEAANPILRLLVKNCTNPSHDGTGLGAIFAAIGQLDPVAQRGDAVADNVAETRGKNSVSPTTATANFSCASGDAAWVSAIDREPVLGLWKKALEAGHVVGSEISISSSDSGTARVIAIPLNANGAHLGILVAAFRSDDASLTTVERLELRGALATAALLRQRREDEARRAAASHRVLLEHSPEPLLLMDASGNISALSRGAKKLVGDREKSPDADVASKQFSGHFAALFSAGETQRIKEWSSEVLRAEGLSTDNLEVEFPNGARVSLRAITPPVEGKIVVGLETRQSRSVSHAGYAEAQLANLIEWLEEGVVLFGPDQEIRAMNSRFAQIAGLSAEECAQLKTLDSLIGRMSSQAADPASFAQHWRQLAENHESGSRDELRLARPAPRVLERAARPVLTADGKCLGHLEIYRDLTAQRVFQSKLLQTEKLAALGQMVTGIAHELSNPLTSILGYAQRLRQSHEAGEAQGEAEQILQEAERASGILRQLLLTARDSGPDWRSVELNDVVSRTIELQRFGSSAEGVRLHADLDPLLPAMHGDAGQLQQVLMNLVGNARQAIEEQGKGGTVRIQTKRLSDQRILLQVSDDGPGIPQAILARIFDPFFTTKPPGVGTGLGLAIVLGIVREHGGQVRVSSPPGSGAIFAIEFPAAKARVETKPSGERVGGLRSPEELEIAHAGAALGGPWVGQHVLVVEDESTVARLIADVLEDEGLRVTVMLDGREALDRAAQQNYDLVICDMKMPSLDGQRFYETLVRRDSRAKERFLFVTGDVLAAHTRSFLVRNHLPHVAKPFRVEELLEQINLAFERIASSATSAPGAKTKVARK